MNNNNLLIIGGSYEQEPLIQKAKDMGYKTIVIDIDDTAPGYKIADVKRKISTTDVESAIKLAKEYKIKGVLTNASESAIITVAKISDALSLPGISVSIAEKATNKELMKKIFKEHNIPTANFFIVKSQEEVEFAVKNIGFPCIIKPVDNAGSRGVLKINNQKEIKDAFKYSINFSQKKKCILEEFIEGIEMSADTLSYKGKTEILAISDKEKLFEGKNNVAMKIIYPPRFEEEEIIKAKQLIKSAVNIIGIKNGPAHTEIIRRGKNDFVVIELGARGGGFWTFSKVVPEICGVDTLKQIINLAIGEPIEIKPKQKKSVVLRFTTAKPGRITELGDIKKVTDLNGVISAGYFLKIGDIVKKLEKDGDRVGYMIISAGTRTEAIEISEKANELLTIKTEKLKEGENYE